MEQLLHYTWMHRLFPLRELRTTDGRLLEVLNPGIHNTDAGPDFTGAKIKLDGAEWAGNVELHLKTSDWFRHHHDTDPAYENIILHVACEVDQPLFYPNGQPIPQLQLPVPAFVHDNFDTLSRSDVRPRCRGVVGDLPLFLVHNWMTTLTLQRFEERARQIMQRRESLDKDWEGTLFVTLARSFGFGINGDAFEQWARSIPLMAVGKHRDNALQVEAFFLGQAGMLCGEAWPERLREQVEKDAYFQQLAGEYRFLAHKFSLEPMDVRLWRYLRLRPQNFPHIRLSQLGRLYVSRQVSLSAVTEASSAEQLRQLLKTRPADYWQTHYQFGAESAPSDKWLGRDAADALIINAVVPTLFAYGRHRRKDALCERALTLLAELKPEENRITRRWQGSGLDVSSAADSQALIQLRLHYCDRKDCLRCRFGWAYMKATGIYHTLQEPENNE